MKRGSFRQWKEDILNNEGKILLSLLFFIIAILLTIISGNYVDETRSISVPDLILDHIPVVNLTFLFVYGISLVVLGFILYPLIFKPKKFYYYMGMLSLFLSVRSAFLVLTHLKAPIGAISIPATGIFSILTYSNDLFFSGHAGLPFLGFLIFENKKLKYFMLISSIVLAATSLLMHVHYSIDVASSYFITYGIYDIGKKIF